jgi:hypothetical protein
MEARREVRSRFALPSLAISALGLTAVAAASQVDVIEQNRMDEERRDEPPGSGEFILYFHMIPKSDEHDLIFEPSAWMG